MKDRSFIDRLRTANRRDQKRMHVLHKNVFFERKKELKVI